MRRKGRGGEQERERFSAAARVLRGMRTSLEGLKLFSGAEVHDRRENAS